jgi:transaldolase
MPLSPLAELRNHGQFFWLDSLSRQMLNDGSLERRIAEQGLSGVTSNPAIFAKAMLGNGGGQGSFAYDARIRIAQQTTAPDDAGVDAEAIYERLAVDDVRDACDLLLPRYEQAMADGASVDGCVSLEVSPHLAHDAEATVRAARRLWDAVGRPNLLIKVPGTRRGIPAVERLLADGINVNITLLFGLDGYEATLQAHLRALERRLREGRAINSVCSVASFFLSRVDIAVDERLRHRIHPQVDPALSATAQAFLGGTAVALARLAYARFREVLSSEGLGAPRRARRTGAAAAVGEHRHQGPEPERCALHRAPHRPGHRHDHAGDHGRCLPRPRHRCADAREHRAGGGRADSAARRGAGDQHGRRRRRAHGRRRAEVHRPL